MTLGLDDPPSRPWPPTLCRSCNDNGDGGICTCCGKLHTAAIVPACQRCSRPVERRSDLLCGACADAVLRRE